MPLSLLFCMILLSLPHFTWDAGLMAGTTGWLLNASSLPLFECFTTCTNPLKNYLQLYINFWQDS